MKAVVREIRGVTDSTMGKVVFRRDVMLQRVKAEKESFVRDLMLRCKLESGQWVET